MAVPFVREGDSLVANEGGTRLRLRPGPSTRAGGLVGDKLLERSSYVLIATGVPEEAERSTLRISGLEVPTSREEGTVVANINLGHEFGKVQFELQAGGYTLINAVAEVTARYLDPVEDFNAIKDDIARIAHNLAYSIWKQATHEGGAQYEGPQGAPEWLALLRASWSRIARTLAMIDRDPNKRLRSVRRERVPGRVRSLDRRSLSWLAQDASAWAECPPYSKVGSVQVRGKRVTPERVLSRDREVSLDTQANRELRFALGRVDRRLRSVLKQMGQLSALHFAAGQKEQYELELHRIKRGIQLHTELGFLRNVGSLTSGRKTSHVSRSDPRYRSVFEDLSRLSWGISLGVGGTAIEMPLRETWELYEYWVYLFIIGLFTEWGWKPESQGVVLAAYGDGALTVDLLRGKPSRVEFEEPTSGARATLVFHKNFPARDEVRGPGLGARSSRRNVDIFLTFQIGQFVYRAVLDPKYQVEKDECGCLVASEDAIDDMHVYRDAVGRWKALPGGGRLFEPFLNAAIAVFPSHSEECARRHRFARSIEDGVGALPLLPENEDTAPWLLPQFIGLFSEGRLEIP